MLSRVKYPTHTITFDNYNGFAGHKNLANALNVKTNLPDHIPVRIKVLLKIESDNSKDFSLKRLTLVL